MTKRDAVKAAAWGALFTFGGTFALGMFGWLNDVGQWASSSGRTPFPGYGALGYSAVAAAVAAAVFVLNAVVRVAQSQKVLPGEGPTYATTRR